MQNNRVKVLQDKRYDYDGFGRLIRKRIGSHTEQYYRYDYQHRLTHVAVVRAGKDGQPQSQVFSYQYDALGRRIAKTDSFGNTHFTWDGMRLLQESRGGHRSTYVYEPGSYAPLARMDADGERSEQGGLGTTRNAQQPKPQKTIAVSQGQISASGQ